MDIVGIDWLNENAYRNYPLVDGASRIAAGGLELPNGLIADLSLPVPLGVAGTIAPQNGFIRSVHGFALGVVITIGDTANPGVDLATATVLTATAALGKSYPLAGLPGTALEGVVGRLAIGLPEAVAQCSMGSFDFSAAPDNARLVLSCIRPLLSGVRGIVVVNAQGVASAVLGGVVELKAGANVQLSADGNTVKIASQVTVTPSQVTDAGCGCDAVVQPPGIPIKTVNGVPPDAAGNFRLVPTGTIELNPIAYGLVISDKDTTPCCGCEQLAQLQSALSQLDVSRGELQQSTDQLQARLSNLGAVVANGGLNPPSTPPSTVDPACWWWLPIGFGGGGAIVPCPS